MFVLPTIKVCALSRVYLIRTDDPGVKFLCLTAWLIPYDMAVFKDAAKLRKEVYVIYLIVHLFNFTQFKS